MFDAGRLAEIGLDRHRGRPGLTEFAYRRLGFGLRPVVVSHQVAPLPGEGQSDAPADAMRAAGHQGDFPLQVHERQTSCRLRADGAAAGMGGRRAGPGSTPDQIRKEEPDVGRTLG